MPPSAAPLSRATRCAPRIALLALCVPAASARSADAYWDTSDELVATVGTAWDDAAGVYRVPGDAAGGRGSTPRCCSVHALAAQAGHAGLSRQDVRAVRIVRRMVTAPAFDARLNPAQAHAPGWGASLDDATFQQHVAIDARVEEALAAAYVAGDTLGLTGTDRAQIRDRLCRVAGSPLYSRPQLNQVNWMADVYAACVAVGGDTRLLRSSYRRWLVWFLEHARTPAPGRKTSNLNAGFGLHYVLQRKTSSALNRLPTTEYNSIIVTALRPYDDAVARGMKPLDRRLIGVARRWQGRVLYGEWTAAGYPNWDTGLGFARWHMRRYWAWSADGLLSIAQGGAIGVSARARAHARATFDAALDLYTRVHRAEAGPAEPPMSFGLVYPEAQEHADWLLVPARFASLAARAAIDGFRGVAARPLPPSYGYDPDIHRLTIATPRYSTAIVPPSRVGNGGAELARLFDASGFPVSGTGGSGASRTGFGVRIVVARTRDPRDAAGRRIGPGGVARVVPRLERRRHVHGQPHRDLQGGGTRRPQGDRHAPLRRDVRHRLPPAARPGWPEGDGAGAVPGVRCGRLRGREAAPPRSRSARRGPRSEAA